MRNFIWEAARKHHPEGMMLPRRFRVLRAILYPLDTFYFLYGERNGYNPQYDAWRIHGARFSSATLRTLAQAQGETYRITRSGERVTLERIGE